MKKNYGNIIKGVLIIILVIFAFGNARGEDDSIERMLIKTIEDNSHKFEKNQSLRNEINDLTIQGNASVMRLKELEDRIASSDTSDRIVLKKLVAEQQLEIEMLNEVIEKLNNLVQANKLTIANYEMDIPRFEYESTIDEKAAALDKAVDIVKEMTIENEALLNENATMHYNLGNLLFQMKDYELALEEYLKAYTHLKNDPDVCYNIAVIYDYFVKNATESLSFYERYLDLKPYAEDTNVVKERIIQKKLEEKMDSDALPELQY